MQKMINIPQLIQVLQQKITQFYQQHKLLDEQKIYAKFDRTLFSEDYQTFAFYRSELNETINQLSRLESHEQIQCHFYSEKLLAQFQALHDAITQPKYVKKSQSSQSPQEKEKQKHAIHQLPPRERLIKYYEALQTLNEKIAHQQAQYHQANNETDKQYYQRYISYTQQRRTRCLEAIELLEEYLNLNKNV